MLGVTGSTGRLGGRVARLLSEVGVEQRLLVRDIDRAPDLPGTTAVRASYDEVPASALEGLSTLLMVSAAESATRLEEHLSFVASAAAAGVGQLVYLSFYGAAPDAVFTLARDHFHTEQAIRSSGLGWTFLRDNLYLDFLPMMAGEDGVLRGPAGDGRFAGVALDDVGRAVAAVLTDPSTHLGATYSLTGPEAISLTEAAALLSEATGRPHTFLDETLEEAYASRAGYGAPEWQVEAWVSTYTAIAAGELAGVTGDVERLTGRPPLSARDLFA